MVLLSSQTKRQSIGYILKGALDSSVPAKRIEDIAEAACIVVPRSAEMDNSETMKYAMQIAKDLGLSEDIADDIKSGVYWAFDNKTVEEAGEICEMLINSLYPFLKRKI